MSVAADCRAFRLRLEERLAGRFVDSGLTELSWHQHLFGCADCRALLEREEALDALLSTLPEPRLPRDLAERVLARLRWTFELELDLLLELAPAPSAPEDLARRVLAGLATERQARQGFAARGEEQLDLLLEEAYPVEVPAELGRRVLEALERHRTPPVRWVLPRPLRRPVLAAAATLLIAAGLWILLPASEPAPEEQIARGPQALPAGTPARIGPEEPEPEFLALLDLLAEDLLWDEDFDLDLVASISLAVQEELLLEFGAPANAPQPPGEEDEG